MTLRKDDETDDGDDTLLLNSVYDALRGSVGATKGRALSKDAVLVDGRIAAFISNGRLVVKLPTNRREALLAGGEAVPMRMGQRVMKEWVAVGPGRLSRWIEIAEESARYVRSCPPKKRR